MTDRQQRLPASTVAILNRLSALEANLQSVANSVSDIKNELQGVKQEVNKLSAHLARIDERTSLIGFIASGVAVVASAIGSAIAYFLGRRP